MSWESGFIYIHTEVSPRKILQQYSHSSILAYTLVSLYTYHSLLSEGLALETLRKGMRCGVNVTRHSAWQGRKVLSLNLVSEINY